MNRRFEEGGKNPKIWVWVAIVGLTTGCSSAPAPQIETSKDPRSRDEQVVDAVMLHFLQDKGKDIYFVNREGDQVVLQIKHPEGTGILNQTEGDIHDRKLDSELLSNLLERNNRIPFETPKFSYKDFRLDKSVVIADVDDLEGKFHHVYRRAMAYFQAFVPGYSQDGQRAVFRAWIGPSPHGATITYRLDLVNGAWKVAWREIAIYV